MLLIRSTLFVALCFVTSQASANLSKTIDWDESVTNNANLSMQMGIDAWKLMPSVANDSNPTLNRRANTFLFLPNAYSKWTYRSVSPWIVISGDLKVTQNTLLNFKYLADQSVGARLDELNFDWSISPLLGIRAGLVNYKTTWCRTYETDSPWMREPDFFCSTSTRKDLRGGAPGIQSYVNLERGDFRYQALTGAYWPKAFNYAPREFSNWDPTPNYYVTSNHKAGISFNAMQMSTGNEIRLSWIHTQQSAFSPEPQVLGVTKQKTDLYYAAANYYLTEKLSLRGTYSLFKMGNTCISSIGEHFECLDQINDKRTVKTLEMLYQVTPKDTFAFAKTKYNIQSTLTGYPTETSDYGTYDNFFAQSHRQSAMAWRRNWNNAVFTTLQYSYVNQTMGYYGEAPLPSSGKAIGLRLGYRY